jgi:hypothetical protein
MANSWAHHVPADATAALTALDYRIGSPTWNDMRATTQALLRRIGAHVATHDKSGLRDLRATQASRLGQVNVRPYSDPEDMAESYANDYGQDLHDHFSLSLREIDDALRKIDQDVQAAVAPHFTLAAIADVRAAEREKRRADVTNQQEQACAAQSAATAAAAAAKYRQEWLRCLPDVAASRGVDGVRALLDAASDDERLVGAPLEALEALRDAGWVTMASPNAAIVLEHVVSRCHAGSGLAKVLWAVATSAAVRNGDSLTAARMLRACAAKFAAPDSERCPVCLDVETCKGARPLLLQAAYAGELVVVRALLSAYEAQGAAEIQGAATAEASSTRVQARLEALTNAEGCNALHMAAKAFGDGRTHVVPICAALARHLDPSRVTHERPPRDFWSLAMACQQESTVLELERAIEAVRPGSIRALAEPSAVSVSR